MTKPFKDISDLYRISLKRVNKKRFWNYMVTLTIFDGTPYNDEHKVLCGSVISALDVIDRLHFEIGSIHAIYPNYRGIPETAHEICRRLYANYF